MKEKTAMMLAIEKIDFVIGLAKDAKNEMEILHTLETLKKDFEELLPKEREQIIEAYNKGEDDTLNDLAERLGKSLYMKFVKPSKDEAIKYYTETYGQ